MWRLESDFNGGLEVGREWVGLRENERSGKKFSKFRALFLFSGAHRDKPSKACRGGRLSDFGIFEILGAHRDKALRACRGGMLSDF